MEIKVKELMEKLSKLDQEKNIHLIYDYYYELPFDIEIAEKSYPRGVKQGDYVINAG